MNPEKRINKCRFIEKMDTKKRYCEKLGIENVSTFHGKLVSEVEVKTDVQHYDSLSYSDTYARVRL